MLVGEMIAGNRKEPESIQEPVALCIGSRSDYNQAFATTSNALTQLYEMGYQILYYEVCTDEELFSALDRNSTRTNIAVVVIFGHGQSRSIALSDWSISNTLSDDARRLDIGDIQERLSKRDPYPQEIPVLLQSCLTGAGMEARTNLANAFGELFPHADIFAFNRKVSNVRILFGSEGSIEGMTCAEGPEAVYRINPKNGR